MRPTHAVFQILLLPMMVAFAGCGEGSPIHPDDREAVDALQGEGVFEIQLNKNGKVRVAMLRKKSLVTDELMAHLSGLDALEMLLLDGASIDDASIEHLSGLTNLEKLSLIGCEITDEGLSHLEGLENLESLDVRTTKVTQSGVDKLQKQLTFCVILFGEIVEEREETLQDF